MTLIRWLLFLVIAWTAFHLLVYYTAPSFIPYLGFFPYGEVSASYHLPAFISSLANFDGEHYLLIARMGYGQYEQAFFPLYPLLIHFGGVLIKGNYLLSAILISFISFLGGVFFFKKYLEEIVAEKKVHSSEWSWILLFLLAFPTSFFFTTVYTEGLFFMLFMATLYFLKKKLYWIVAVLAFLTSLSRLIGVFIVIPIFFSLVDEYLINGKEFSVKQLMQAQLRPFLVIVAPFLSLLSYCLYLWKTTGDPLFFLSAQSAFGAQRSSQLILFPQVIYRYIKIFISSQHNFQYFISVVEFTFFAFVFLVLCLDLIQLLRDRRRAHFLDRISLNIFSWINLLLPTFTGTFSSIPRYVLMSFSVFIFLGELKNTTLKIALLVIFVALHILLFGFFIQGYFIS